MKKRTLCIFAVSGLLIGSAPLSFAERIAYRELPESVRKSLKKDREDIKHIDSFNRNGQTVYEVQLDKKGEDRFIYLDKDGTRLNDSSLRNERLSKARNLKFDDLPKAVQKTFRHESGSTKFASANMHRVDGKSVYVIDYNRKGEKEQMRINEDGSLAQRTEEGNATAQETSAGFDRPLAATEKVNFESVPEAVKRTVRDVAGSSRIEDAERGRLDGRTIYEIAFKKEGQHNELRVAEDGSIVQRVAGTNIRFPGALSVNEVPGPVQRAIKEEVGSGEVNDIDKKTVDGKTVYEVGFKRESGGVQHEIQIAEDGTVLGEPAGAEKK